MATPIRKVAVKIALLVLLYGLAVTHSSSQEKAILKDIKITGNLRVEDDGIRLHLKSRPGEPFNQGTVEQDVKAFADGARAASITSASSWSTQEWQHFLVTLPHKLTPAQLADLDRTFHLSERHNSEVLFAWLRVAIRNHYEPAMPALEQFLTSVGRRKFLRPLYEDLMKTDWGKDDARRIYAKARPLYHSMSTTTLDPIVKSP